VIDAPQKVRPFRIDLVDFTRQLLIEAKFVSTVEDVRMAVGQQAHYTYLVGRSNPRPLETVKGEVVLLGDEPGEEIKEFLKEFADRTCMGRRRRLSRPPARDRPLDQPIRRGSLNEAPRASPSRRPALPEKDLLGIARHDLPVVGSVDGDEKGIQVGRAALYEE
jgi:hypothetical protein